MVIAGFSLMTMLLILLAGIGAGFVGYAVGASSLVSYPALLALGIPPVLANASNTVGVIGTGVGGVLGARKELRGQRLRSITYVSIGAVGGVAGAALLLSLDPKIFEFAVPPLILFSSLIIAVNPRGRMQARQAAADVMAQARSLTTPQGQGSDGAPASALASTQPMSKDPGGYGSASRSWRYTADISAPVPAHARSRCSTQARSVRSIRSMRSRR